VDFRNVGGLLELSGDNGVALTGSLQLGGTHSPPLPGLCGEGDAVQRGGAFLAEYAQGPQG
jgi:hypothetical protein